MKKVLFPMIIGVIFMLTPMLALGASMTGTIQGFTCVTQGKICPIGKEDPTAAVENVFVLLVDQAKGEYYFIPNVDRAVLARHIAETVRVDGDVNMKMKSVKASDMYAKAKSGAWKKFWSSNLDDPIYENVWGGPPASPSHD